MSMSPHESLQPLVDFYLGFATDHADREMDDVLNLDDAELETQHDYIQWLFPLAEPSGAVPGSPVLDENQVGVFRSNHALQIRVLEAFDRMLEFYGLTRLRDKGDTLAIVRLKSFSERRRRWLKPRNHNLLRITRILKSLRLLGLEAQAQAFFRCLEAIYREERSVIGEVTLRFWANAVKS
jgi:hypothetical protein